MRHAQLMAKLAEVNQAAQIASGLAPSALITDMNIDVTKTYAAPGPHTFVVTYRSVPLENNANKHTLLLFFVTSSSVGLSHAQLMERTDEMEQLTRAFYGALEDSGLDVQVLAQEPVYNVTAAMVSGFSVKMEVTTFMDC